MPQSNILLLCKKPVYNTCLSQNSTMNMLFPVVFNSYYIRSFIVYTINSFHVVQNNMRNVRLCLYFSFLSSAHSVKMGAFLGQALTLFSHYTLFASETSASSQFQLSSLSQWPRLPQPQPAQTLGLPMSNRTFCDDDNVLIMCGVQRGNHQSHRTIEHII